MHGQKQSLTQAVKLTSDPGFGRIIRSFDLEINRSNSGFQLQSYYFVF